MAADPDPTADDLNLGLLLFIPYRALENRVFDALVEAGFDDFTPAQARVMQRIGPAGTRLTELAEASQVTKQTAGRPPDARPDRRPRPAGAARRARDLGPARGRRRRRRGGGRVARPPGRAPLAAAAGGAHVPSRGDRPVPLSPGGASRRVLSGRRSVTPRASSHSMSGTATRRLVPHA